MHLGVVLITNLTIQSVCSSIYYHTRALCYIRPAVSDCRCYIRCIPGKNPVWVMPTPCSTAHQQLISINYSVHKIPSCHSSPVLLVTAFTTNKSPLAPSSEMNWI